MARDLTEAEYQRQLKKAGISIEYGMMGFHHVGHGTSVSIWNAPVQTRRGKLAYLLGEQARVNERARQRELAKETP